MTTPAMLFGVIVRGVMVALTAFWVASFLIIRIAIFAEAMQEAKSVQADEAWLLQQCQDPDFYSKMRLHTDLCIQVQRNAERSPVIVALKAVANTAHLCGRHSCGEVLVWLGEGGWPTLLWMGLALLIGNLLLSMLQRFLVLKRSPYVYKDPAHSL